MPSIKYLSTALLMLIALLALTLPVSSTASEALQSLLTEEEQAWIASHPEISVGIDAKWPPINFIDEQGRHKGITDDYIELLEQYTGIRFRPKAAGSWNEMLRQARARKIDIVANLARSPEREKIWDFSIPYYWSPYVIVTRKESDGIKDLASLYNKPVSVEQGYNQHTRLATDHPQIKLLPVEDTLQALLAVSRAEADAYVGNQTPLFYLIEKHRLTNLKVAADAGYPDSQIHFAVRPDWPELRSIIDKTLKLIPREQVRSLERKWLGLETEAYTSSFVLSKEEQAWPFTFQRSYLLSS